MREGLTIERILPFTEGADVELPAGFDMTAVQVEGDGSQRPVRGALRHAGWRARPWSTDPGSPGVVLMPAVVEYLRANRYLKRSFSCLDHPSRWMSLAL